jgi:hypothetical protein
MAPVWPLGCTGATQRHRVGKMRRLTIRPDPAWPCLRDRLQSSPAGIPGEMEPAGIEPATSWVRLPAGEVLSILHRVDQPLSRNVVFGEWGVYGAGFNARVAIDALLGVNVKLFYEIVLWLVRRGMNAVHRAHLRA